MTAYHQRLNAGHYTAPPTPDDLENATVADLKEQLAAQGKPTSGNKDELLARLNETNEPATDNE